MESAAQLHHHHQQQLQQQQQQHQQQLQAQHAPRFPSFPCATDRRAPTAFAVAADGAKLLHLVRHGQGTHNVEAALRGV